MSSDSGRAGPGLPLTGIISEPSVVLMGRGHHHGIDKRAGGILCMWAIHSWLVAEATKWASGEWDWPIVALTVGVVDVQ